MATTDLINKPEYIEYLDSKQSISDNQKYDYAYTTYELENPRSSRDIAPEIRSLRPRYNDIKDGHGNGLGRCDCCVGHER